MDINANVSIDILCVGLHAVCRLAIVVIPKNQPLPKYLRKKKKRVKVRSTTGHYATKKRPVKITMYLGLDIIINLKFTTNFDRCAILNVLNYLSKNFES